MLISHIFRWRFLWNKLPPNGTSRHQPHDMIVVSSLKVRYNHFSSNMYFISITPKVDSNEQLNSEHGRKEVRISLHMVEKHTYWTLWIRLKQNGRWTMVILRPQKEFIISGVRQWFCLKHGNHISSSTRKCDDCRVIEICESGICDKWYDLISAVKLIARDSSLENSNPPGTVFKDNLVTEDSNISE